MNTPLFSCVIPVKGERPFFGEAVDSLKAQGLGDNLEIIVQDADVEPDAGQSDALNKGFAKAKGEWLFWLNADDVLLPGALGKVRDFISRVEGGGVDSRKERKERKDDGRVDWIAGDTVYLDEKGIVKDVRTDAKWRSWFGKHLSVWTGGPSAFFRRELWENRG
ncbi:MAG: glycosyltransferase, partial [Kiritimatiellae bacterium]|nr:glycosyltransferase [Kiritimatiellia bacterium]